MERRALLLITGLTVISFSKCIANEYSQVVPDPLLICPESNISIVNGIHEFPHEFVSKYAFYNNISLLARFTEGHPQCNEGSLSISVQYNSSHDPAHGMLLNGWILKYISADLWVNIPPNKYCVMSGIDGEDEFEIKYCQPNCDIQPCVSKCCFANEVCNLGSSDTVCHCSDSGSRTLSSTLNRQLGFNGNYSFVHHIYDGEACAAHHFTLQQGNKKFNASYQNEFQILKNGSVQLLRNYDKKWITLPEGKYCVDGVGYSSHDDSVEFSGERTDMVLQICRSEQDLQPEDETQHHFILHTILVPFAIVFVLLTITVYILTWSEQNIYGYTIFFYLVTLLLLYVFIVVGNARTLFYANHHPSACAFVAGAIHFTYLSSACWVTCISFDVWRTFRKMNSVTSQSKGKRRFTLFCSFSIGYPLMQVMACAILDGTFRDVPSEELQIILPNYGRMGVCNMSNDGVSYYLYIPITVLLLCNIGFFVATISSMIRYKKSIREAFADFSENVNPSTANQSFGIYARLFIIMGLSWISQIISWFVLLNESHTAQGLKLLFAVTDALTVLQAVAIFYIFVCKRSVFANLWALHPWLRPFLLLWVRNGCCTIPSPDARKGHVRNSYSPKGTLKSTSVEKNAPVYSRNNSRESNSSTAKRFDRQSSLNSADGSCVTTASEIDDGQTTKGAANETVSNKNVAETKV